MQQLKKSEPSICIPRVYDSVDWKQVKETIEELLGKGCVERVDLVHKTDDRGEPFGRVYIHFRYWPKTESAQAIRQKLMEPDGFVQIVYDPPKPWYWKCSKSRVPKPDRSKPRQAPYVVAPAGATAVVPAASEDYQQQYPALGSDAEGDALSEADTVEGAVAEPPSAE